MPMGDITVSTPESNPNVQVFDFSSDDDDLDL
jgi:hypothetical protein